MKYLKLYESIEAEKDEINNYLYSSFDPPKFDNFHILKNSSWVEYRSDKLFIYVAPFYRNFEAITIQAVEPRGSNRFNCMWKEEVDLPKESEMEKFLNWYTYLIKNIIPISEKAFKTYEIVKILKNIRFKNIEEKVYDFLESAKHDYMDKDIVYDFANLYDELVDIEEAIKLGFFPKKKD